MSNYFFRKRLKTIAHWSWLYRNIRTPNSGRTPNQEGKESFIWLFPRTRVSNVVQFTNDLGIHPCNWFWLKSIIFNLLPFLHIWGMLPWKLFLLRLRIDKEKLRFPKQFGSMPLKLLYDKSRVTREPRLQIICGISPVSVLFETE